MRCMYLVFSIVILVTAFGCGGPQFGTVKGNVLVDGQPLANGTISFVPAEGESEPASVAVTNGAYELRITPGPKLVQISGPVVTGRRKEFEGSNAQMVEITEESIPEKFNVRTTLKFDVVAGKNNKDWTISKAK